MAGLSWLGVARLGLVQTALGAIVVLTTSTLNRVMVVELALPAAIPGLLVGWHFALQLTRPSWGHGADRTRRCTPWIIGGMAVLALGGFLAATAVAWAASAPAAGLVLAAVAFTLIGLGVGASGTSLLALMAAAVAPERRAGAASLAWIMMILGFVVTAGVAGGLLDPFTYDRLVLIAAGVCGLAFLVSTLAVLGIERDVRAPSAGGASPSHPPFRQALAEVWSERDARRFAIFIFVSMLAYSLQDLILEPFAGLVFDFSPGRSTQLSGIQNAGVLLGMIGVAALAGLKGARFSGRPRWAAAGCIGSGAALAGLAIGARIGAPWPIEANVFLLGFSNGVFAVSAIGAMMGLADHGRSGRQGVRLGVWGAAQAIAFGGGGLLGALMLDAARASLGSDASAFGLVFAVEAFMFVAAAALAVRVVEARAATDAPLTPVQFEIVAGR